MSAQVMPIRSAAVLVKRQSFPRRRHLSAPEVRLPRSSKGGPDTLMIQLFRDSTVWQRVASEKSTAAKNSTMAKGSMLDGLAVRISLASPEQVRGWTSGVVTKPETVNFRTYRPERDGLFCQRIFGPERDWECACGKYQGMKYNGMVCDRCGVHVIHSRARRTRLGRIELATPVIHAWFLKQPASVLSALLGMKTSDIERVVYFHDYVVISPRQTSMLRGDLLNEAQFAAATTQFGKGAFEAAMGAEAIQRMLAKLNLVELAQELRAELEETNSAAKRQQLIRRIKLVEALRDSDNRPEWIALTVLPVIPPDLRPLVQLESGVFASSDLNELYRRIIHRNNRLQKLLDIQAPEVIVRNEKRMLQQSIDALFDNGARKQKVFGQGNRPLTSLSDMITGKQGRFRENLLGKRVDYSARSVIVSGPKLKLHQCGLPKKIALELYQPFVIGRLKELDSALTIKSAKRMIQRAPENVWAALEHVTRNHPVLLNRAPTLHRLGIQAFDPILIEGNAIRLHPLVCKGFNADFDGDQMAVHLPLSIQAQVEAHTLMMSTNNIFSPANGRPIITPSQDIVLGCYYLTMTPSQHTKPSGMCFATADEVHVAYAQGVVGRHSLIRFDLPAQRESWIAREKCEATGGITGGIIETTVGRVLFNDILPDGLPFYNFPLRSGELAGVIGDVYRLRGRRATLDLLDQVKQLGFEQATESGISFAMSDLVTPKSKPQILADADQAVDRIRHDWQLGLLTDLERHVRVVETWTQAREQITKDLMRDLAADSRGEGYVNPIYLMAHSGARGGVEQVRQLSGMRGLMARPNGDIIETPIKSSFRDGLSVLEYFRSAHGARKGLIDTALKTADAGYLTHKLADVAQHVVVTTHDCGTTRGIHKPLIREEKIVGPPSPSPLIGRVSLDKVRHPQSGEILLRANELIDAAAVARLHDAEIKTVEVRSPLTCDAPSGMCQFCYGLDLSTGSLVEEGLAVGIIAAQSIGEPGTQLTMRTFHFGGTAGKDITGGLPRVTALFEAREPQARQILAADGAEAAMRFLMAEIQEIYRSNGVEIDDKHFEVIITQMLSKVQIEKAGDTSLVPGSLVDKGQFRRANDELKRCRKIRVPGGTELSPGSIVPLDLLEQQNADAVAKGGQPAQGGRPKLATATPRMLPITKSAMQGESFTAAASFQQTVRILTESALASRVDPLAGLKENVLLGRLVPTGTGFSAHHRAQLVIRQAKTLLQFV
jgi:DNA-directed RNA polymerase subunit beta'